MTVSPSPTVFRDARALGDGDLAPLLALNNAHAAELPFLTPGQLRALLDLAWLARAAADGSTLLLPFDHAADSDSPNFHWLRGRWPGFACMDRAVVSPAARRRGIARALYA